MLRGLQLFRGTPIAYSVGNFATAGSALSTGGILGESAILGGTLGSDGRFVSGKLVPVQMIGGAPRRSYGSDIVRRVNALSRADFGRSALLATTTGALRIG